MNIELSDTIQSTVDSVAGRLLSAQAKRQRMPLLSAECRNLNSDLAYRIQDEALSQRIERGEHIVGIKVQSGSSPIPLTGWLTDAMALRAQDHLPAELLVHPGVEPVIAVRRKGGGSPVPASPRRPRWRQSTSYSRAWKSRTAATRTAGALRPTW